MTDITRPIPAKRKLFAEKFIVYRKGAKAAIEAGYSKNRAKQTAYELLKDPRVLDIIFAGIEKSSKETGVDAKWVLKGAKEMYERCMQHKPVMEKVDGKWVESGEYTFDSAGAGKALKLAGDHINVQAFKENVVVNASKDLLDFLSNIPSTTGPPSER